MGEGRQTYTGFSWSWDRHYLPDHIWGFRFYASGTFTYIRIISGVTEEKGGSIDEYRKNIDHDRSFCSLYLLFEGSSVSGFRRITEDAGLAGRLGKTLPSAIMAVLIVYCLKDVGSDVVHIGLPKIAAVVIVALSYKWKHNTLVSIAVGTAGYMILLRVAAML